MGMSSSISGTLKPQNPFKQPLRSAVSTNYFSGSKKSDRGRSKMRAAANRSYVPKIEASKMGVQSIQSKDQFNRELEVILQEADTKIWSSKLDAMEKILSLIENLGPRVIPSTKDMKKLISLITTFMTDNHFKVVLKSNDTIKQILQHFDPSVIERYVESIVFSALTTASD